MENQQFFRSHDGMTLADLAKALDLELATSANSEVIVRRLASIATAKDDEICYAMSRSYKAELQASQAGAVICSESVLDIVPPHMSAIVSSAPRGDFARAGELLMPDAMRPLHISDADGVSAKAEVSPEAHLEDDVCVEAFAVIGAGASIGRGSRIGPGAVIGQGVQIGRNSTIAAGTTILHAILGDNVIVHNGTRIGQDGFGYAPGKRGLQKVIQIGRVIIQDNVEIGANTTIDRGTLDDTIIGDGTKIDNLVQVGHNVRIGRHCIIVAKVGIAGSTVIGDGVVIGGAAGLKGHIHIGDGAQIAGMSGVVSNVPAGEKYGGYPARPFKEFLRETVEVMVRASAKNKTKG